MEQSFFLLYVSQAKDSLDRELQKNLADESISVAQSKGTTGVLIYRNGFFMQYIEGNELNVFEVFRWLRGASYHFNVRVLSQGHLENRIFKDLTFRLVAGQEAIPSSSSLIDLLETVLSSRSVTSGELQAVLRRFWRNSEVFSSALPFSYQRINTLRF